MSMSPAVVSARDERIIQSIVVVEKKRKNYAHNWRVIVTELLTDAGGYAHPPTIIPQYTLCSLIPLTTFFFILLFPQLQSWGTRGKIEPSIARYQARGFYAGVYKRHPKLLWARGRAWCWLGMKIHLWTSLSLSLSIPCLHLYFFILPRHNGTLGY